MRGEPVALCPKRKDITHFNSLAPCGANPDVVCDIVAIAEISTHSPRAGRTDSATGINSENANFNSLAPCGANPRPFVNLKIFRKFQLTRPVRGEPQVRALTGLSQAISTHSPRAGRTDQRITLAEMKIDFNSLAPCGANQLVFDALAVFVYISTHSPRAGRTVRKSQETTVKIISTHSPRAGRTAILRYGGVNAQISTHSPRAGRTSFPLLQSHLIYDFNSLAPCGANPLRRLRSTFTARFQLTRPVRGEPAVSVICSAYNNNFNSLAPCGANPDHTTRYFLPTLFQLTRPVRGEPKYKR